MPEVSRDLKPRKAKRDHKADEKDKVQSREEASFDDDGKAKKPTGKSATHNDGPLEWDDSEYPPLSEDDLKKMFGEDYAEQQEENEDENNDEDDNENDDMN